MLQHEVRMGSKRPLIGEVSGSQVVKVRVHNWRCSSN